MKLFESEVSSYWDLAIDFLQVYGLKVLGAVVVLVIGLWVIKWAVKAIDTLMV